MVKQKRDYEVKKELMALFLFAQYNDINCWYVIFFQVPKYGCIVIKLKQMLIKFDKLDYNYEGLKYLYVVKAPGKRFIVNKKNINFEIADMLWQFIDILCASISM